MATQSENTQEVKSVNQQLIDIGFHHSHRGVGFFMMEGPPDKFIETIRILQKNGFFLAKGQPIHKYHLWMQQEGGVSALAVSVWQAGWHFFRTWKNPVRVMFMLDGFKKGRTR